MHHAIFLCTEHRSNTRAWLQNWTKTPDGPSCHLTLHVKYLVLQEDTDTSAPSENKLACTQHTPTSYVQWYYAHFMVDESLTDVNWGRTDDFGGIFFETHAGKGTSIQRKQ